jgi:hypothetical protein
MQRGIERTVLHLKKIVGCPLNVFPNLMTMGGAESSVRRMSMSSVP